MINRLRTWWRGEQIYPDPREIDIESLLKVGTKNHGDKSHYIYKRPLARKIIEPVWLFYLRHWQFIISTIVAIVLAILAIIFSG